VKRKEKLLDEEKEKVEILKKSRRVYRTARMKYEAIHKLTSFHSARKMCKVLKVNERGYYQWLKQEKRRNARIKAEIGLVNQVAHVFHESKETYGSRKIHRQLVNLDLPISEWKVRQIMRRNGLYSVVKKNYKAYSYKKLNTRYEEDLLRQNFTVDTPNQVRVSDITYIKTTLGWHYLACVMDLYNREVIGYSTSKNIDTELVKRALSNAIAKYPEVEGTVFHSDRGSPYASAGLKNILEVHGIVTLHVQIRMPLRQLLHGEFYRLPQKRMHLSKAVFLPFRCGERSLSIHRTLL
jgi:transposase InsO family protein